MAEGLTLGVSPKVPYLPHGVYVAHAYAAEPEGSEDGQLAVTRTFTDTALEIRELIDSMFGLYTERGSEDLKSLLRYAFTPNAVWDVPFVHVQGADNIRIISCFLNVPFRKVGVKPKLVTVQMLTTELGRIDVVATLRFYPRRFFPYTLVIPEYFDLHGTWTIVAKGDDDRILSVTETLHNLPGMPLLVKKLLSFLGTTAGSLIGLS
jgi:hypothetical protein